MIPDIVLFIILAVVAVVSALGMLFSRNAVYSALNLIVNFGAVAVFYLMLGAPFIALAQVTVYAGAIMVLFLFVIMLMGAERLRAATSLPWQQPAAYILVATLLLEAAYVIFIRPAAISSLQPLPPDFGSPSSVGLRLFDQYTLPFEITSVLLLVAMIGAIVLSKRRRSRGRF